MRRIRETLRLPLQAGLSYSEVGRALKIFKSVVGKHVLMACTLAVDVPPRRMLDVIDAHRPRVFIRPAADPASRRAALVAQSDAGSP